MDKLLSAFVNEYINSLNEKDLIDLEKLLDLDDNSLYNFYNGLSTNIEFKDNKINTLFKNYKFNKN